MAREASTARDRAARCFALARSTTFKSERQAAIAIGIGLCELAGLDLGDFDIPGRSRPGHSGTAPVARADRAGYSAQDVRELMPRHYGHRAAGRWGSSLSDALHELEASVVRSSEALGAADDADIGDARRKAFDRAAAAARQRDLARGEPS